jgi:hypothetical protein
VGEINSPASAAVAFTGSVVMPPLVGNTAVVRAPFLFSGLFEHPDPADPLQARLETLTGRGTATLLLRTFSDIPGTWRYTDAEYEFAPVPEPGRLPWLAAASRYTRRVPAGDIVIDDDGYRGSETDEVLSLDDPSIRLFIRFWVGRAPPVASNCHERATHNRNW